MPDPVSSTATPFFDADGSIVVAVASRHQYNDPHVRFGLRRIQPDGEYDTAFGLGVPSIAAPAAGAQAASCSSSRSPARTPQPQRRGRRHRLDGRQAVRGGLRRVGREYLRSARARLAAYSVLLVSRWQGDGSRGKHLRRQRRAGGGLPRLDFTHRGVLGRSRASSWCAGRGRTGRDGAERRRQRDGHHVNRGAPPPSRRCSGWPTPAASTPPSGRAAPSGWRCRSSRRR